MLARITKDKWVRCPNCGHKLFRIVKDIDIDKAEKNRLEVKCHSCKSIVEVDI